MRTRVTPKPWFGPKRALGWGWTPVSWEGWVTTGVFVALTIVVGSFWGGHLLLPLIVLIVAFLVVVFLTGDPPGGPESRRRS
jgi:hypothetical protein